jgi:hypothetical protein
MTIDTRSRERFLRLTKTMDIPAERREPTSPNLMWFLRNAWIKNGTHANLQSATDIAKRFS